MTMPDDAERAEFDAMWRQLSIPGEFDAMDAFDQERWRGVIEVAWLSGRAALRASTQAQPATADDRAAFEAWRRAEGSEEADSV